MTTFLPIAAPSFHETTKHLVELALAHPYNETPHAYVTVDDTTGVAHPYCLVAHVYVMSGGNANIFYSPVQVGALLNEKRVNTAWRYLFITPESFVSLRESANESADFLTRMLLSYAQNAQDHNKDKTWRASVIFALTKMRRIMNSKTGGFLVQTQGAHKQLLVNANISINSALTILNSTK